MAIRSIVYRLRGERCEFGGLAAWAYELPKDTGTYVLLVVPLSDGRMRVRRRAVPAMAASPVPQAEPVVIREGERTYRAAPDEILAVGAAGNCAEFGLADGRRPLMRVTLFALEKRLASSGFARSHRSWLLDPNHVREIVATGGGDYLIKMSSDVEVPLSRRHAILPDRLRRSDEELE